MYDLPDALILPIVTKIHPLNYMLLANLDIPKANRAQLRGSRTSTLIVPVISTVGLVHLCSCAISFQQTSRHTDLALAAHHPSQLDRHGIRIYHTEHYRDSNSTRTLKVTLRSIPPLRLCFSVWLEQAVAAAAEPSTAWTVAVQLQPDNPRPGGNKCCWADRAVAVPKAVRCIQGGSEAARAVLGCYGQFKHL
ncbi:uncharacterized protein BO95DRAFT_458468 [Aspergillus brunneoviolaceus CBS 621.78]|uniref:Uncharacterized protein n=1 Tax=Aspergillus brunneoviolaceus CBS 621.78 TaxID=1450534 RepID=A0ACD1GPE3_9EURO|nr:hypothetical protein BO95DRAFT_458468 [Aspergillus brunneoviolaceus CBS 621.78]RAH51113.1 hypothetical protein BO95DRAFT_458468 [Aspergillus brunneoviolaceus CBS 621.78]